MSKDGTLYKNSKFLKGKTQLPYDPSISVLEYIPKRNGKVCPQKKLYMISKERKEKTKNLYMNVHGNISDNSQKVEIIQMSIN